MPIPARLMRGKTYNALSSVLIWSFSVALVAASASLVLAMTRWRDPRRKRRLMRFAILAAALAALIAGRQWRLWHGFLPSQGRRVEHQLPSKKEVHTMGSKMTDQEFAAWAAEHGVSSEIIEQLTLCAATPEEMEEAYEAIELPPPIYALEDIKEISESSDYGFCPLEHHFLVIGGCPNGDPIAVDIADDMGSVWYINHESMHNSPPRSIAVKVADDVERLLNGIAYEDGFPIDYFEAKKRQK